MKSKEIIVKKIQKMVGKYSAYNIFYDWVKLCAISVSNSCTFKHDEVWKKREEEYIATKSKYTKNELVEFAEMFELLCLALEENIEDVLGETYMKSGCYSKELGQFFTPFHLALLNAEVGMPKTITEDETLTMNEPSTGGGSNIIAGAAVLKKRGLNYQKILRVTAQDLDWLGVYMTYLQLSLLGIDAKVAQGDTLCEPFNGYNYPANRVFRTPKNTGAII